MKEKTKNDAAAKRKTNGRYHDKRSERHIRYQMRMANLLRKCGFRHVQIEKPMPCAITDHKGSTIRLRYRLDVYGDRGNCKVAIEIDGYVGHKSRLALALDELRIRRIREKYGKIKFHRLTFSRLAKWTDKEIKEEMRL